MEPRHASGFTLVELVITVSVLALLASFALPGFTAIMQNNAMTASANELITAFTLARSEALKRESPVTICWTDSANADAPDCGDGNGWHSGWLIFADEDADGAFDDDEDVIRRQVGLAGRNITIQVRTTAAPLDTALTYLPTGVPELHDHAPGRTQHAVLRPARRRRRGPCRQHVADRTPRGAHRPRRRGPGDEL
jgi:prepilin-type N-terminal cleavage/methylation domain-containing protein